jgi:hypothetical protein
MADFRFKSNRKGGKAPSDFSLRLRVLAVIYGLFPDFKIQ